MRRDMSKQEFERYWRRVAIWQWIIRLAIVAILIGLAVITPS